jgi:23S rRNA pseudouridine1911/1915/1917 synthase
MPHQALHAKTLGITHPVTGERLHFDSDLPADMQEVIDKWTTYSKALSSDLPHN